MFVEPRGFGFVTFRDRESIEKVMLANDHEIDGKKVECKLAVPKELKMSKPQIKKPLDDPIENYAELLDNELKS